MHIIDELLQKYSEKFGRARASALWVSIIAMPMLANYLITSYPFIHYLNYLLPLICLAGIFVSRALVLAMLVFCGLMAFELILKSNHVGFETVTVSHFGANFEEVQNLLGLIFEFEHYKEPLRVFIVSLIVALMLKCHGLEKAFNTALLSIAGLMLLWLASLYLSYPFPATKGDISILLVLLVLHCVLISKQLTITQLMIMGGMLLVLQSRSNIVIGCIGLAYLFYIQENRPTLKKAIFLLTSVVGLLGLWFLSDFLIGTLLKLIFVHGMWREIFIYLQLVLRFNGSTKRLLYFCRCQN